MESLFPTGRAASPEDVVGRQNFIAEASERGDILLAAPRRLGKSSVWAARC